MKKILIFIILFLPCNSFAAITALTHLKFNSTTTATSGTSINTAGATLIVVHVGESAFTLGTIVVSDNQGNTYTGLTAKTAVNSISVRSRIFYVQNPTTNAAHTFTVTVGGSPFVLNWSAEVQAFSGTLTAAAFDVENGASATTGATLQTGSVTPNQANSLVVSGFGSDTGTSDATVDSSMTITDKLTSGPKSALAYIVQTLASAINPTWSTNAGSGDNAAVIAVFKPTAAVTTGSPLRVLSNGVFTNLTVN